MSTQTLDDVLLTESQVAEKLGLKVNTLAVWRHRGRGPIYTRVVGRVRYRQSDLAAFLDSCRVIPSDNAKPARARRQVGTSRGSR